LLCDRFPTITDSTQLAGQTYGALSYQSVKFALPRRFTLAGFSIIALQVSNSAAYGSCVACVPKRRVDHAFRHFGRFTVCPPHSSRICLSGWVALQTTVT